jgi:hypothetical protein
MLRKAQAQAQAALLRARALLPAALPPLPALPSWRPAALRALPGVGALLRPGAALASLAALPRAALSSAGGAVQDAVASRLRKAALLTVGAVCLVAFAYGAGAALPGAVAASLRATKEKE